MRADRLRAIALTEWRGLPEIPFPKDTSKPIDKILGKVLADLGIKSQIKQEEALQAWAELVGPFFAANASPQSLHHGVLSVRVLQSTIHYELDRVWKPQILKRFQERFGPRTVREIRFRLG